MYSNNILNFQESTAILNAHTKKVWKLIVCTSYFFCELEDWGSIPGGVIPKTQKIILNAALLSTQYYKVRIKGKVEQSRERSSVLHVVANEKGAFRLPSTLVANFIFLLIT